MTQAPDKARNATWRLLLGVHSHVVAAIQADLAAANLPPLEWYDVLWALKEAPDQRLRLSELADLVLLSRSNLTRLLDRLEKQQLVRREPCPSDRRGTFAVLTPAGQAMQARMWDVYGAGIATYFGNGLSDEEVTLVRHVLQKILDP